MNIRNRSVALVLGTVLPALLSTAPAQAAGLTPSEITVFGDSYSDVGNNYWSNGKLWVEYLLPQFGLNATPGNQGGNVFAQAGNRTNDLSTQIGNYMATGPAIDTNELFIVEAGINDYYTGQTDITIPVSNIVSSLSTLYDAGARNFFVSNLYDLARMPSGWAGLTDLALQHNSALQTALADFEASHAGSDVILFDLYDLVEDVTASPAAFGFTNVTQQCQYNSACTDADEYFFWDTVHPTTAGYEAIANRAFSTIENAQAVPEPIAPIPALLGAGLFLGWMHRRGATTSR
jgi:phospholipase/lecithinase/hemolysin